MAYSVTDHAKCFPSYIRRADLDDLLDAGKIYCRMTNGNWWQIRRNGKTRTWKRDAQCIAVPFKMGFRGYGTIDESFFRLGGVLAPEHFRHEDDLRETR